MDSHFLHFDKNFKILPVAHIPHIEALAPGSTGNHRPDALTKIEQGEVNTKLLPQFLPKTPQVAYINNQVKSTVILCQLPLLTCLTRMYLTSELSPSLSTPGWTTAVKSSSKIWTTFEWYTVNLRSTSTQMHLYVCSNDFSEIWPYWMYLMFHVWSRFNHPDHSPSPCCVPHWHKPRPEPWSHHQRHFKMMSWRY